MIPRPHHSARPGDGIVWAYVAPTRMATVPFNGPNAQARRWPQVRTRPASDRISLQLVQVRLCNTPISDLSSLLSGVAAARNHKICRHSGISHDIYLPFRQLWAKIYSDNMLAIATGGNVREHRWDVSAVGVTPAFDTSGAAGGNGGRSVQQTPAAQSCRRA